MNGYSFEDVIKNSINLIYTKVCWRGARLVRRPILARNRKKIYFGPGFTSGTGCRLNPGNKGKIVVGKNFVMGDYCQIEAMKRVTIGDNVLLASRVYIGDASHGKYKGEIQSSPMEAPNSRMIDMNEINIKDNVWIGNNAAILAGTSIGFGSIIGANSVVTHNIPSKSIAVGNPAKVIKKYNDTTKKWEMI